MACETAKQAWDLLKAEFQGSEQTKQMSILNLRREFEVLKMKESESLKDYIDKLMNVVNKIRLLGVNLGFYRSTIAAGTELEKPESVPTGLKSESIRKLAGRDVLCQLSLCGLVYGFWKRWITMWLNIIQLLFRDATSNTKGEVDEYNGSFTQLDDHGYFQADGSHMKHIKAGDRKCDDDLTIKKTTNPMTLINLMKNLSLHGYNPKSNYVKKPIENSIPVVPVP
ncbi:hypothetical protein GH714_021709 [Hevea brasiliensis]|uniref:Uncharacterized protein n=1 Tax=Hevea brasiliensis TaxID=3981 RepID=A0A6A6N624_HEVBR|nr:hypothetical protein GH714_021709 [Hevea brasiliensis]